MFMDLRNHKLTARELDVLVLLVNGDTNKKIALALSISEYSVKKHVSSIIQKLFALNRVHAAAIAVRKGLVEPVFSGEPKQFPSFPEEWQEPPWEALTEREKQIFMLFSDEQAADLTNVELAKRLCISKNTLRKHLRSIYKKLKTSSRVGLVHLALEAKRSQKDNS